MHAYYVCMYNYCCICMNVCCGHLRDIQKALRLERHPDCGGEVVHKYINGAS